MKMPRNARTQFKTDRKYRKPSERTAQFILGIWDWFHDIFTSTSTVVPHGYVTQHTGDHLPAGSVLQYPNILLVEDNPHTAEDFIAAIKSFYVFGSVNIFVAHTFVSAVTFFDNEEINLVIMDADLDDEDGDGSVLIQKFLGEQPKIPILANSSRRISNLKLTGLGAIEILNKSREKLTNWLLLHDPAGASR